MTEVEKEYFEICAFRYLHPLPKGEYGERHHVLPKSCGGFDLPINIVRLTPEEHYRCHCLLPKIFDEMGALEEKKKMLFAWRYVANTHKGIPISEKEYGKLKREHSKMISASLKGKPSWNKGRVNTDEYKRKMSLRLKGRIPWNKGVPSSKEANAKRSAALKGKKFSEDHCRKISESLRKSLRSKGT